MKLPAFEYAVPHSLAEAATLLAEAKGEAKIIAGGQSLLPLMAFRLAAPSLLVDLRKLRDLAAIEVRHDGVHLGALVRWCDIECDPSLPEHHPLLRAAIDHVAHYQVRHRGTIGGSVAHADPAAELPCVAVTCDGEISIYGKTGARVVKAADFFKGPLHTDLGPDEIVVGLRLPVWKPGRRFSFQEFAKRRGDFALGGIALHFDLDERSKIANPHVGVLGAFESPTRLTAVERLLQGASLDDSTIALAAALARDSVDPPGDIHASAAYRKSLIGTLLERGLRQAGYGKN